MKRVTIYEASVVFNIHAKEILKLARRSGKHGFRVLAEVSNEGEWRGACVVTPGAGSLLAHEGRGLAAYFSCNSYCSLTDIYNQISEWYEQKQSQIDAEAYDSAFPE